MRDLAAALEVTNIEFIGWQPAEEIARYAAEAHLLLGIFGRTDKAKRVIPNKVVVAFTGQASDYG